MGLDMFFVDGSGNEIKYFRKHADLHGFLSELWCAKNPDKTSWDFNCKKLRITKDILRKLRKFVDGPHDEHYTGFFWGHSTNEDWEETKVLLDDIERRLNNKERVYYDSWW